MGYVTGNEVCGLLRVVRFRMTCKQAVEKSLSRKCEFARLAACDFSRARTCVCAQRIK
jgi:hypothetical protein